jgi:hypothetical protein
VEFFDRAEEGIQVEVQDGAHVPIIKRKKQKGADTVNCTP